MTFQSPKPAGGGLPKPAGGGLPKPAGGGLPKPGSCLGGSSGFGSQEHGFLPLSVSEEARAWPENPSVRQ